ncbi:major coat protein [Escherichia coli]|nr:major coat protein [Escherichia coli]
MDALLTQANDLIGKVWPVVVAVVGAGLAIRIFKNSLQKRFEFHSGHSLPLY